MRSKYIKPVFILLLAACFAACKKEGNSVVATAGTAGSLKTSATSLVLDRSMLNTNVVTFTFSPADFGYRAAVTNSLQMAVKGTNFAQPKEVLLEGNNTSKSYNGMEFNNLLLSLNLPFTSNTDVEVRLKSSISNAVAPVYSSAVSINARPFPLTSWIYVPGAYQGWNPATADSLISETGNGVYTGIINFTPGNLAFKLTPAKKWDVAYGDAGGGKLSTSGGDIVSPGTGTQLLTIDLNANTWKMEAAPVWSLIGNAVPGSNWEKDIDLKYVNAKEPYWTITTALTPGAMKFRRGHDWGTNIGNGGSDITVTEAGTYEIVLKVNADNKTGTYTLTKK
ncbi:SusE domain-containing protein [Pedobacter sp. SYP-B3415]|uniref:SusE domain-containing protein n=1 Tax=Pedobacter sp. SYP-B3415 TaxID=2496641 RepID=UPI00101C7B5D|nr:SusE domain-containing protein [Pedobacter sp. SYP-B3415]